MAKHKLPRVVLVGRRNVGKSALFNRILEEDRAIVSDIAGTTRDRTEATAQWRDSVFTITDTGGLDVGNDDVIDAEVRRQAEYAIKTADVIIFVADVTTGLGPAERDIVRQFLPHRNRVVFAANKADSPTLHLEAKNPRWQNLGLGQPMGVSAANGTGVGDLLDAVYEHIKGKNKVTAKPIFSLAIVGKPNVGKSSLLNALAREDRAIVSPIAHTTREPQDTMIEWDGIPIKLIDTAGIRKRAKTSPGIEKMGVIRSIEAIKKSDVVIFVVDPTEGLNVQDKNIARAILEARTGVVIAANKSDMLEATESSVRRMFPQFNFAKVVPVSALKRRGLATLMRAAVQSSENRKRRIPDEELSELVPLIRPKPGKSKTGIAPFKLHIKHVFQDAIEPPGFAVAVGMRERIPQPLLDRLVKFIRDKYDFEGTPITVGARHER